MYVCPSRTLPASVAAGDFTQAQSMEETHSIYRDFRFWLAVAFFAVLVLLTLESYPLG